MFTPFGVMKAMDIEFGARDLNGLEALSSRNAVYASRHMVSFSNLRGIVRASLAVVACGAGVVAVAGGVEASLHIMSKPIVLNNCIIAAIAVEKAERRAA